MSKVDKKKEELLNEVIHFLNTLDTEELQKYKDFINGVRFAKEYNIKKGA